MTSLVGLDAMNASTVSSEMVNVRIRSHKWALIAKMSVRNANLRTWSAGKNVTLALTHTSMMRVSN